MDFQMLFSLYFARRTSTSAVSVSVLFILIFPQLLVGALPMQLWIAFLLVGDAI